MYKYAQIMTKTGSMYFNTVCPNWCQAAEEDLCDDVMRDILAGGNFGRKNVVRSSAGLMISQHGKNGTRDGRIQNLWKTMLGGVKGYHYTTLEKVPFLYPVFIIEFVIKRIWKVCTGKRVPLKESVKYVEERKSVYDRLEIFETDLNV